MNKIAVLADTHLLSETQERIRALMNETLSFPTEDTQPTFEELIKRTGDASAILVSPGTKITEAYLTACPSVKYIGICGTSKENVDTAATAKRGITLTNVVDYGDEPAAEFIFMQLVQLARGVGDYQWREYPTELMNKSVGIIGLGPLGKAIAHLALAYKMKVSYYSRTRKPDQEQLGIHYMDKDDLLRSSEIIIVSTPTNLVAINTEDFGLINANAVVV